MARHTCPNRYYGEGANGGCYVEVEPGCTEGTVALDVGWSCVVVHRGEIPVTWLSELVAIATGHKDGIAGFLAEHNYGGGYALEVDPPKIPVAPAPVSTRVVAKSPLLTAPYGRTEP